MLSRKPFICTTLDTYLGSQGAFVFQALTVELPATVQALTLPSLCHSLWHLQVTITQKKFDQTYKCCSYYIWEKKLNKATFKTEIGSWLCKPLLLISSMYLQQFQAQLFLSSVSFTLSFSAYNYLLFLFVHSSCTHNRDQ